MDMYSAYVGIVEIFINLELLLRITIEVYVSTDPAFGKDSVYDSDLFQEVVNNIVYDAYEKDLDALEIAEKNFKTYPNGYMEMLKCKAERVLEVSKAMLDSVRKIRIVKYE